MRWTSEEDAWIVNNYPALGIQEGFEQFQKTFGKRHTLESFKTRRRDLGVHVTPKRWREACQNNGKRENVPIGTITTRGRGENYIKVSKGTDGWIPLKKHILGKTKLNEMIVHLDGNKSNDDADNLMVIERTVGAAMTGNKFWSANPIITKTAILCCQLERALDEM